LNQHRLQQFDRANGEAQQVAHHHQINKQKHVFNACYNFDTIFLSSYACVKSDQSLDEIHTHCNTITLFIAATVSASLAMQITSCNEFDGTNAPNSSNIIFAASSFGYPKMPLERRGIATVIAPTLSAQRSELKKARRSLFSSPRVPPAQIGPTACTTHLQGNSPPPVTHAPPSEIVPCCFTYAALSFTNSWPPDVVSA
jgi:hypothetical protein